MIKLNSVKAVLLGTALCLLVAIVLPIRSNLNEIPCSVDNQKSGTKSGMIIDLGTVLDASYDKGYTTKIIYPGKIGGNSYTSIGMKKGNFQLKFSVIFAGNKGTFGWSSKSNYLKYELYDSSGSLIESKDVTKNVGSPTTYTYSFTALGNLNYTPGTLTTYTLSLFSTKNDGHENDHHSESGESCKYIFKINATS